MLSLFSEMKREELCQLYVYPSIPNIPACSSFYRVTDKDVLHAYWRFQVCGREIVCDETCCRIFENQADEAIYRNPKNKKAARMLARDMLWKWAHWYNADFRHWLDQQRPSCIFVTPGSAKFLYDIAAKIAGERKIPIVTYICDDDYFVKPGKGLLEKVRLGLLRRKISGFLAGTSHLVTICREMETLYTEHFALKATTLMTGSTISPVVHASGKEPRVITYFGNIRGGRHHSLADVGRVLDEINALHQTDFILKIYSMEKNDQVLSAFSGISSVELGGFVAGEAYEQAFSETDFLIHVEGFDVKSIDRVKHSVSTKIADCLASGIPLIAYGPAQVASMGHLMRNQCAFVATGPEQLRDVLLCAFYDKEACCGIAAKARVTAQKYHNSAENSRELRKILEDVTERRRP